MVLAKLVPLTLALACASVPAATPAAPAKPGTLPTAVHAVVPPARAPADTSQCAGHPNPRCQELCANPDLGSPACVDAIHEMADLERACGFTCSSKSGTWRCVRTQAPTPHATAQHAPESCEPLQPEEQALIGQPGYDPKGCTRQQRTAKQQIRFDNGLFNGLHAPVR
jgi:hypothetical protein